MTLKELRKIDGLIEDLWDFFSTNTDGDESGLMESVAKEYSATRKIIKNEFFKLHMRNSLQRERSKLNKI